MAFNNPSVICEVTRPKLVGIGEHAGVLFPNGQVVHHGPEGIRVDSVTGFAQGRPITVVRTATPEQHEQIVGRTRSLLRQPPPYRLGDSNCEHIASQLMVGKRDSRQINGLLGLGLFFAVIQLLP
ncbi:lecithin retinol acyltransferase family protein [Rhodoferax sp.]|uniref:lecithin retinol acyltransferase family protein n=1 Tax=Rhodoferax sp. TaxID=50421 RepID=UPI00374DE08E